MSQPGHTKQMASEAAATASKAGVVKLGKLTGADSVKTTEGAIARIAGRMPPTRSFAISAHCRDCSHDPEAPGTWTQQVASCSALSCSLWRFRPVPRGAPDWLASRDPARLPAGWTMMSLEKSLGFVRGVHASPHSATSALQNATSAGIDGLPLPQAANSQDFGGDAAEKEAA